MHINRNRIKSILTYYGNVALHSHFQFLHFTLLINLLVCTRVMWNNQKSESKATLPMEQVWKKINFILLNFPNRCLALTTLWIPFIGKYFILGGVHKGRHLLLGGEGVRQMVTQSDMEVGRGLAKGDVTSKCPKNERILSIRISSITQICLKKV